MLQYTYRWLFYDANCTGFNASHHNEKWSNAGNEWLRWLFKDVFTVSWLKINHLLHQDLFPVCLTFTIDRKKTWLRRAKRGRGIVPCSPNPKLIGKWIEQLWKVYKLWKELCQRRRQKSDSRGQIRMNRQTIVERGWMDERWMERAPVCVITLGILNKSLHMLGSDLAFASPAFISS